MDFYSAAYCSLWSSSSRKNMDSPTKDHNLYETSFEIPFSKVNAAKPSKTKGGKLLFFPTRRIQFIRLKLRRKKARQARSK